MGIIVDFVAYGCLIRFIGFPKSLKQDYRRKDVEYKEYFHYLSKVERLKIFDDFKKELVKWQKLDDNQSFDIRVISTKEELKGISLEIYKINELC